MEVIGCTLVYALGPIQGNGDEWMQRHLNVPASAVVRELRFFRCGHGPNFELFEYEVDDQVTQVPRNCDIGGHHLAFYVDDFNAALQYLGERGVRILGEPTIRTSGPSAGQTWVYFLTPWGMQLELVSFPDGKAYEKNATVRLWNPACPAE